MPAEPHVRVRIRVRSKSTAPSPPTIGPTAPRDGPPWGGLVAVVIAGLVFWTVQSWPAPTTYAPPASVVPRASASPAMPAKAPTVQANFARFGEGALVFENARAPFDNVGVGPPAAFSFATGKTAPIQNWPRLPLYGMPSDPTWAMVGGRAQHGGYHDISILQSATGTVYDPRLRDGVNHTPLLSRSGSFYVLREVDAPEITDVKSGKSQPFPCARIDRSYAVLVMGDIIEAYVRPSRTGNQAVHLFSPQSGSCRSFLLPGLDGAAAVVPQQDLGGVWVISGASILSVDGTHISEVAKVDKVGGLAGTAQWDTGTGLISATGEDMILHAGSRYLVLAIRTGQTTELPIPKNSNYPLAWVDRFPTVHAPAFSVSVTPNKGQRGVRFAFTIQGAAPGQPLSWQVKNPSGAAVGQGSAWISPAGTYSDTGGSGGFAYASGLSSAAGSHRVVATVGSIDSETQFQVVN